jgi:hypothetical protein
VLPTHTTTALVIGNLWIQGHGSTILIGPVSLTQSLHIVHTWSGNMVLVLQQLVACSSRRRGSTVARLESSRRQMYSLKKTVARSELQRISILLLTIFNVVCRPSVSMHLAKAGNERSHSLSLIFRKKLPVSKLVFIHITLGAPCHILCGTVVSTVPARHDTVWSGSRSQQ